jgi:hypothetical protein
MLRAIKVAAPIESDVSKPYDVGTNQTSQPA